MSSKHYSEVYDIPLFNWEKVLQGKYQFMRLKPSKEKFNEADIKAFYTLYNTYIKEYGLTSEQKKYLKLKEDYIKLYIKYAETDDAFILNQLSIIEADIEKLDPAKHQGMTIGQTIVWLSKWMGTWIDKKSITLAEFKDLIKEYERANEEK